MGNNYWKPLIAVFVIVLAVDFFATMTGRQVGEGEAAISYSRFKDELARDNVKSVIVKGSSLRGEFRAKTVVMPRLPGRRRRRLPRSPRSCRTLPTPASWRNWKSARLR